ncbi:hypothetical protein [Streptomyces ardesiacus]|uniref:hypothetical protein n=1 Tax=Streptomyces ardesiacus TaxID=285564 RepID=UPI000B1DC22B
MRPAPHAAAVRSGRIGACLRVLVLLLVLVVPGAHVAAPAAPVAGATAEYDHLDTVLRVPGRSGRPVAVLRPAPPSSLTGRRRAVLLRRAARGEGAPSLPRGPRSVVLRC